MSESDPKQPRPTPPPVVPPAAPPPPEDDSLSFRETLAATKMMAQFGKLMAEAEKMEGAFDDTDDPFPPPPEADISVPKPPPTPAETARAWIRDNQTFAMLGAFGIGVFIGVLMRD